jgi:hypothetical protein
MECFAVALCVRKWCLSCGEINLISETACMERNIFSEKLYLKIGGLIIMPRPNKAGLDYFELDCHLDERVRLIQAEFGLKGFAVVVKLYQKIYGEIGYYCEWNEDSLLLFVSENGASSCGEKNLISEIITACIKRNIFSEKLFCEYGILTSEEIQKNYLNAVSRREKVEMKKEYLLLSVPKKFKNVVINPVNVDRNKENVDINSQSRVEKSRVENINTLCKAEALALFEEKLWPLYPVKKGKGQVSLAAKQRLLKVGYEEMVRAIDRYKAELERDCDWRRPQNGSTFFNSGYVDYLDANYVPGRDRLRKKKNSFNNFPQREYDNSVQLEKQLLRN